MPGSGTAEVEGAYLKLIATPKHFAGYSLEEIDGISRHEFNAVIAARDMEDSYLPIFEALVRDAGAKGIMCSCEDADALAMP